MSSSQEMDYRGTLLMAIVCGVASVWAWSAMDKFNKLWAHDTKVINSGEAADREFTIVKKYVQETGSGADASETHWVVFTTDHGEEHSLSVTGLEYRPLYPGQKFTGWKVEDRFRVDQLSAHVAGGGKVLACIPGIVSIVLLIVSIREYSLLKRDEDAKAVAAV